MNDLRLRKSERIVSRKQIEQLFTGKGSHSKAAFPVKAVFCDRRPEVHETPEASGSPEACGACRVQILVSVPKKRLKHAVDRNRVKRQLRESYRKNKHLLQDALPEDSAIAIAFIWLSDKTISSGQVEERMRKLLAEIGQAVNTTR